MKKSFMAFLIGSVCFSLCLLPFVADAAVIVYDKYLSAADIQQVTGIKDVKPVPKDPAKGFGGDLNFAASGKPLLMVQIVGKENYPVFKKYGTGGVVKGLGDEAVQGATMPGFPPNYVCFVKGGFCVALTTYFNLENPDTNMLTLDQVTAIAKIIAGRI